MRKTLATLIGIGTAAPLLAFVAPSASASTASPTNTVAKFNCLPYSIGTICLWRVHDESSNSYYFYGEYENTGASPHTGHIDLYINSNNVHTGTGVTVQPGGDHVSQTHSDKSGENVHVDWVDKSGTHFHSPTEPATF